MEHSHTTQQRLATLSLAALGVVYGDIGTSPLYAIKEVFAGPHHPVPVTPDNVLGILSLIFWALIIVVTFKYVFFILRADNKGEGGIIALMALALRNKPENSRSYKLILALGLIGASLFYGDGVVTPAISVLSAVEGIEIITPTLKPFIIPITLTVLITLFFIQSRGTTTVGRLFGPVMALWFGTLALLGLSAIWNEPGVLQAINPYYAFHFLQEHPLLGFFSLGAVVLSLTGAEALYADMGHFGRKPIQAAWLYAVLPALLLNYFGQGALLLSNPKAISNPFYLLAPEWALYPLVVLATSATVIAAQAVISGAFSMTQQAMHLGFCPRLELQHTSDRTIGQIYLPTINWIMLITIILLVVGFGSSSNLAAAYGIAVTGTMLCTSVLAFFVLQEIWGWNRWLALLAALPLVCIDIALFSACSVKIADGGWFPLVFGLILFTLMITWKRGRKLLQKRLSDDAIELVPFIRSLAYDTSLIRVPGTAMYMTGNLEGVPHAMLHSLKHYKVIHERVVLVAVTVLDIPRVANAQRVYVEKLSGQFWRVKVFYGFMEDPNLPETLDWCAEQGLDFDLMDTSFFLGRETLIARTDSEMNYWFEKIFIAMFRNANSAAVFFKLPANRVVEMGTQVEL